MSTKVIGLMQLLDLDSFEEYRGRVGQTVALFQGKILSRGTVTKVFWNELGCETFNTIVELEFPSQAKAQEWSSSPEYQNLIAVRSRAMKLTLFAAEI
jgi:uncharacterized protein (DUF1330 family)